MIAIYVKGRVRHGLWWKRRRWANEVLGLAIVGGDRKPVELLVQEIRALGKWNLGFLTEKRRMADAGINGLSHWSTQLS